MRLVTFSTDAGPRIGALDGENVIDLAAAYQRQHGHAAPFFHDMIGLLRQGQAGLQAAADTIQAGRESQLAHPVKSLALLPPVLRPGKVIALGRNYAAHAAEGGADPPEYPMLFHKTATSLIGAGQPIVIPSVTDKVDYEGELAVIMGRDCRHVSEADALTYVAGYTVANDVSARDWQRRTSQFTAGKMMDTFGPLGPALVTRDEIPDVQDLGVQTRLNGQIMQDSRTSFMIFTVAFTVSYISQISTLEVGDVILTGTPEGVGFARKPPVWLRPGDEVTVEIEKIGVLSNPVKAE